MWLTSTAAGATQFENELAVGDSIRIQPPGSKACQVRRIVEMKPGDEKGRRASASSQRERTLLRLGVATMRQRRRRDDDDDDDSDTLRLDSDACECFLCARTELCRWCFCSRRHCHTSVTGTLINYCGYEFARRGTLGQCWRSE